MFAASLLLIAALLMHAVASQGPQCRVPVGLLILLHVHVKLPAFRNFAKSRKFSALSIYAILMLNLTGPHVAALRGRLNHFARVLLRRDLAQATETSL